MKVLMVMNGAFGVLYFEGKTGSAYNSLTFRLICEADLKNVRFEVIFAA